MRQCTVWIGFCTPGQALSTSLSVLALTHFAFTSQMPDVTECWAAIHSTDRSGPTGHESAGSDLIITVSKGVVNELILQIPMQFIFLL